MSLAADLVNLPTVSLNDRDLTALIASRYHQGMPISKISSQVLIAVNTFVSLDVNQDQVFQDLAARAATRMRRRMESQVIMFLGETGTGKTEFSTAVTKHLLTLADNPLSSRVRGVCPILQAFTTAKTAVSTNSSKLGVIFELQYDVDANLIGSSVYDYRLEASRVTKIPTNERNYHVFYHMLSGLSDAELYYLQLTSPTAQRYRYLGHPSQLRLKGVDDKSKFDELKLAFFSFGFSRTDVANIFQVLAAILHLGQIQYKPALIDASRSQTRAVEVANPDILDFASSLLGVAPERLEACLICKTVTVNKDRVTVVLDQRGAQENTDYMARTLYIMLFSWIMERINQTISMNSCNSDGEVSPQISTTISIVDFPGINLSTSAPHDRLLHNTANELFYNYMNYVFFEQSCETLATEDITLPKFEYYDNSDAVKALTRPRFGLLSVIADYSKREKSDSQLLDTICRRFAESEYIIPKKERESFVVKHYGGEVEYGVHGFMDDAKESISGDILSLFMNSTSSSFIKSVFSSSAIVDDTFGQNIVAAHISSEPQRQPSVLRSSTSPKRTRSRRYSTAARSRQDENPFQNPRSRVPNTRGPKIDDSQLHNIKDPGRCSQFVVSFDKAIDSFDGRNTYFVLCLKPNDHRIASSLDARCVRQQITALGVSDVARRIQSADLTVFIPFNEFLLFVNETVNPNESERDKTISIVKKQKWPDRDMRVGTTGIFLSETAWLQIVDPKMTFADEAAHKYADNAEDNSPASIFVDGTDNNFRGGFDNMFKLSSNAMDNTTTGLTDKTNVILDNNSASRESIARRNWLAVVWLYTWWVPTVFLRKIGKLEVKSVQIAWREKFAINLIIWGMCAGCMLFLIGFPYLVCPLQNIISMAQLSGYSYDENPSNVYVAVRGVVYDITKFANSHYPSVVPSLDVLHYGGRDVSSLFPMQLSSVCAGKNGTLSDYLVMGNSRNYTDKNAQYHDFRYFKNDSRPDWYLQQMQYFNTHFKKSYVGITPKDIEIMVSKKQRTVGIIHGYVYDVTDYINGNVFARGPVGEDIPDGIDLKFMDNSLMELFQRKSGQDISKFFDKLNMDTDMRSRMNRCLRNVFMIGQLDVSGSTRCLFARYFLLAITCFVVAIIVVKFLAAMQFGGYDYPDELDRFVICQIPAYTEDEHSLRRGIDSVARTKYDDKRMLLVVICDGMIIGAGNDKPTPRIVLDILGSPENINPAAFSFESLGEGDNQHNMAKVYTGLYEVGGHIVPYLVIVKVGKPTEAFKPGNRGKRDSQLILMRFLNRVHQNAPLNPFELELYHQFQDVIGVNPGFYEFLFQMDADTVVSPESLSQLIGCMARDNKVQAVCGETELSNARQSFITMIQVYEYYISHNLAKAFESLFGSVTCLPGCFSLYRIFEQRTGKPILVSSAVVDAYSENNVKTLHMKNLLHLGEDRYLTTLLLKFNPQYSTKYLRYAHAWTVAPDSWSVFLSQRRRWINSTIHNLIELMPLSHLCGCCFFGMRFMVLIDLFGTFIQPVTCGYIAYLIYLCIQYQDRIPIACIILVCAIYGLQSVIFIVRQKWEMIGWMIVYIIALPIFSFAIPLYSFWYMDDLSWGSTRIVVGGHGKKMLVPENEEPYDPSQIPLKRWNDCDAEVWNPEESFMEFDNQSEITRVPSGQSAKYSLKTKHSVSVKVNSVRGSPETDTFAFPTDAELTEAIRKIIKGADLTKLTKRKVREKLETQLNCDLAMRKEYISWAIEAILSDEL